MNRSVLAFPLLVLFAWAAACGDSETASQDPDSTVDGGIVGDGQGEGVHDVPIIGPLIDGSVDSAGPDGPLVDSAPPDDLRVDAPDPCNNGQLDSGESDIDCGGLLCGKCAEGRACQDNPDCLSDLCLDNICRAPCSVWQKAVAADLNDTSVDSTTGRIFSVGQQGSQGYLLEVDACGLDVQVKNHVDAAMSSTSFSAVKAYGGNYLWVGGEAEPLVGSTGGVGYFGRLFSASLLPAAKLFTVDATTGRDAIVDVDHDGVHGFMAGRQDWGGTNQLAWAFSAAATGAYCDFTLYPGQALGVRVIGSDVYYLGINETVATVSRMSAASCTVPGCSTTGCATTWSVDHQVNTHNTRVVDLTVARYQGVDYLYLVGFYNLPHATEVDTGAFVVRIRLDEVNQRKAYLWNPSERIDSFTAIVSDGTALYIGGSQNALFGGTDGTPTAKALSLDLQPKWETTVGSFRSFSDVELIGTDGLLFTGGNALGSQLVRCLRNGRCTP